MSGRGPFVAVRMRTAADEVAAPKYAHTEIERRWLVDPVTAGTLSAVDPMRITDRYISNTRLRLREMHFAGETVWKLTKKYECADPLVRPIVTAYLTACEHDVFARLPALVLEKQRFRVEHEGHDFSLDQFAGPLDGLWLAEIEMAAEPALRALNNPSWTVRDITRDGRYQGATLARNGLPAE